MSFERLKYLRHSLVEIEYVVERQRGLAEAEFLRGQTLLRAFVRSLEIVGEAAKTVPEEFRALHPQVEWRSMTG